MNWMLTRRSRKAARITKRRVCEQEIVSKYWEDRAVWDEKRKRWKYLVMGFTCAILWINWLGSTRWSLASYGYNKAIEDSEKEHGCDRKTKSVKWKRKIGYGDEKGFLNFSEWAANFNGNPRLVMEKRSAEGPNNCSLSWTWIEKGRKEHVMTLNRESNNCPFALKF
jgi:hypothetical protein